MMSNIFGFNQDQAVYWLFEAYGFGLFMAFTFGMLRWLVISVIERFGYK